MRIFDFEHYALFLFNMNMYVLGIEYFPVWVEY